MSNGPANQLILAYLQTVGEAMEATAENPGEAETATPTGKHGIIRVYRGLSYMTSTTFGDFLTPSPSLSAKLEYLLTPSLPFLLGRYIWRAPN